VNLTDTQRRLLSAASRRDDRALERPSNLTRGVAGKVTAKLLAEGVVEEIQSRGSLPVWRRDGDNVHMDLHRGKTALVVIRVPAAATESVVDVETGPARLDRRVELVEHAAVSRGASSCAAILQTSDRRLRWAGDAPLCGQRPSPTCISGSGRSVEVAGLVAAGDPINACP
jgi:hypothetical protein